MKLPPDRADWRRATCDILRAGASSILPPDPARLRARQAARAVAAGVITLGLVKGLGAIAPIGLGEQMLGFVLGLFVTALVRDATPALQRGTILLAILPGSAASLLAKALGPTGWLAGAGLVGVLTLATYFASRGPRAMTLGTVAMLAYVVSLLGHTPLRLFPMEILVIALAGVVACGVHETLWLERPPRVLARIRAAMQQRIAAMLTPMAAAAETGHWPVGARRSLTRAMVHLDEASALAETLLGAPGVTREAVLEVIAIDLSATILARKLLDSLPATTEERAAIASELAGVRRMIAGPMSDAMADAPQAGLLAAISRLAGEPGPPQAAAEEAAGPPAPRMASAARVGPGAPIGAGARRAMQVALAVTAAILVGRVFSTRWYWAGIVAFIVIVGTRSHGETLVKAARFLVGTLGGVMVGVLLATALTGHDDALFAMTVVALFLAFQASMAAYAWMVFWLTIALGLGFGLLGYFAPDLLAQRLMECVLGAGAGITASALVLPIRAADIVEMTKRQYWRALGAVVEASVPGLITGRGDTAIVPLLVTLDTRLADVRTALGPLRHPPLTGPRVWSERPLRILLSCHLRASALGRLAATSGLPVPPGPARLIETEARRIAVWIRRLCVESVETPMPAADPGSASPADPQTELAVMLLLRLDSGLARAERLA